MKRSIILFIISFLIAAGACVGVYYMLQQKAANQQPEQPKQPTATEQTATPGTTATTAPAEQPQAPEVKAPTPLPETTPTPDLPAEQPQAPTPKTEKEMAAAVQKAMVSTDPATALAGLLGDPAIVQAVADWAARHPKFKMEEVGNSSGTDGSKTTRFRLVSTDGSGDALMDVTRHADGTVTVDSFTPTGSDKTALAPGADSLTVAEGFVEAVKRGDMSTARRMISGKKVSDATIAGLCMIFEEGAYALRNNAPIRNTFENDAHSGYLVYVNPQDQESAKPGNIGLELAKNQASWRITDVSLDSLLSSYESSGNAENGHYFPIVKNPKGGDSLALFFGFDESSLTPRSMRQLEIVAALLKESKRKLEISGHTDDVGSAEYNLKLSEKRAAAVKQALVGFGVDAAQISTQGMGKSQPRRTYSTDDSDQEINTVRGENRRAEIYLDFE